MSEHPANRSRPAHQTAGSPQRPARQLAGEVLSFDLAQEIASLKQEASWQRGDRNARTLVEEPSLRITMVVAKTGARIGEHRADGSVSIQALEGHVRIQTPRQTVDLAAGHLLALDRGVPHAVEVVQESAFLVTITH